MVNVALDVTAQPHYLKYRHPPVGEVGLLHCDLVPILLDHNSVRAETHEPT